MSGRPLGHHSGANPVGCRRNRPVAPGRHRVAHAQVERSIRGPSDLESEPQDIPQSIRHRHPCPHGRSVEAHESAIGLPGGHLCVHFIDSNLQRRAGRPLIKTRSHEEQRRPACAHGRAVQGVAHQFSRHLRHNAPRLSAPQASARSARGSRPARRRRPQPCHARRRPSPAPHP